jgi:hypothetical protein
VRAGADRRQVGADLRDGVPGGADVRRHRLGWTTLATIHLCLHAPGAAWQFLLAPSWLVLTSGRPKPPPAWLRRLQWLYTAAHRAFLARPLAVVLLVKPTEAFAHDLRGLEESFIDRALGEPGHGKPLDKGGR